MKNILIFLVYLFIIPLSLFAQSPTPNPDMWVTNGPVHAIAVDGDYTYIGGEFSYVGPNTGYGAKLTTTSSSPNMNFPKVNGPIWIAVPDGNGGWYIGGEFTKVGTFVRNKIAHINSDGTVDAAWNPNANDRVSSIAISSSDIYVGGRFTSIGGQSRNYLAKLNNTDGNADLTWNPNASSWVYTIAISGSDIYAGGTFTTIGGQTINYIAKLNNTNGNADATWNPNADSWVYTIAISGSDIYAGGLFTSIGGQSRNYIAKLNNTNGNADGTWNPNAGNQVYTIAISGSDIYAGGLFTSIGGQSRNYIAKLNNTNGNADGTWNPNAGNQVYTIAISGSDIYTGGTFTTIGGQTRNYIAKLNNTNGNADATWDPDAGSSVRAIAVSGSDIYFGGQFTSIGGKTRNNVFRLNNTNGNVDATWNPNANGDVYTIAISGSDTYVGGGFTSIGGQARNRLAKLNNTNGNADATWNPNADGNVYAIAISGSDVYVGGEFWTIGGQTRNMIAKLNNTNGNADGTWNPNANHSVRTIAISGSDIYVGGLFTSIGGQSRNFIAKLNNTNGDADATWNPNANREVFTIAISGSDIYVGGYFTSIGGQSINRLAKLNNTNGDADATWNPNADWGVLTIAISGSDIYVGGGFTSIGGQSRNYIAKLNNTNGNADGTWNPNANDWVWTIAISGSNIFVGGYFTEMNGNSQSYFALFGNLGLTPPSAPTASSATLITASSFNANWNSSTGATGYYLDVATDNLFTTFVAGLNNLDVGNVTTKSVTGLSSGTTYYYRVRAYNPGGTSGNSNTISQVTLPSDPVATSATNITVNSFSANWNSSTGATGYYLDVATDNLFTTFVTGFDNLDVGNATTKSVAGLSSGTTYYYRVRAYNSGGTSGNSNTISQVTLPSDPVATSATNITVNSFSANWNSSTGATGYYLDVATDNLFTTFVTGFNNLDVGNATTKSVTGLSSGTTYYYRVRAYNSGGTSGNSNIISLITLTSAPTLSSPINGTTGQSVLPSFDWSDVTGAATYRLYIDNNDNSSDGELFSVPLIPNSAYSTFTNILTIIPNVPLTNSTLYYWRVAGVNASGQGTSSSYYHFTTAPGFTVTLNSPLNGQQIQSSTVNFQWSLGHGSSGLRFIVQYKHSSTAPTNGEDEAFWSGASFTQLSPTTSLNINSNALLLGKNYYWRVLIQRNYSPYDYVYYPAANIYNTFTTEGGLSVSLTPNWPKDYTIVYTNTPRLDWIVNGYTSGLTYQVRYQRTDLAGWTTSADNLTNLYYNVPSNLYPGKTYEWQIRAKYGSNYTDWSSSAYFVVNGVGTLEIPTANYPRDGVTIYTNTPRLDWVLTTNGTGLTYQICYVQSNVDPGVDVDGKLNGATNYPAAVGSFSSDKYLTLPSLTPGQTYWWQVRAYSSTIADLGGTAYSTWSPRTSFVNNGPGTLVIPTPNYPIGGVTVYSTSQTLNWYLSPYSTGLTFEIDFGTSLNGTVDYTTTNMNYTVSGLTPGTTYYWRVRSKNSLGSTSDWSSAVSFVVTGGTAQSYAVAGWPVGGVTQYTNTPYASWYLQGSTLGIIGYNVKYNKSSSPSNWLSFDPTVTPAATNDATDGQFLNLNASTFSQQLGADFANGLTYGATYYWAVYANGTTSFNPLGQGHFVVVGGPGSTTIVNSNPSNGSVTNNTTVYFSWYVNGSSLGIVDYELVYSYSDVFDPLATTTVSGITSQTKTITGLTNGTTWYWKVRGRYSDNSVTTYSDIYHFTIQQGTIPSVQPLIGGPHNVVISTSAPTFSWAIPVPSSAGMKYELEYANNLNFNNSIKIENISNQYAVVHGLNSYTKYFWRVRSKSANGSYSYYSKIGNFNIDRVTEVAEMTDLPTKFSLNQNYPNPFNPSTKISFDLPEAARVTIKVYNTLGQLVATLASNEFLNAGSYERTFDASKLPSGMYIYQLNSDKFTAYKKMLMVK